jgi:hypothetical protein
MVSKEFPSWTAFISWKEEEESSSHSYFVQPKGETETCDENAGVSRVVMYVCCRDGKRKGHNGPNKSGKTRKPGNLKDFVWHE